MIISFTIDHLRQIEASQLVGMDLSAYQHTKGPAMTLVKYGEIIGCGGVNELWGGVGEAWLILGDKAFDYPVTVLRQTVRNFRTMIGKFHRIQAHVLEGFDKGVQLVSALGFELEGTLKQYGPNKENYLRYVILR